MPGRDLFAEDQPKGRDLFADTTAATEAPASRSVGPMGMSVPSGAMSSFGSFLKNQARSAADMGEGALSVLNMPQDFGINLYNAIAGKNVPTASQTIAQKVGDYLPPDRSPTGQVITAVRRGVGGAALPIGAGAAISALPGATGAVGSTLAANPLTQLTSAATGSASGDVARQMGAPGWGQALASLAGGAVPVLGSAAWQATRPNPNMPSADMLKDVARDKYAKLRESDATISQQDFRDMSQKMGATMEDFGLTSVQDVKDLYPKLGKAVGRITSAIESGGDVPLNDVMNLRKLIKLSAGSIDRSERALAMGLSENLDDLVANSTSLPAEARSLWSRASNSEMVNNLVQKAADSANNYTASGFENAIRTQFRNFVKNDKKMRMLGPDQKEAMRLVAQGSLGGNFLRAMGRFAPRGPVSVGVDSLLGGGPLGAAALATVGETGRQGATAATNRNVQLVLEAMLRSASTPPKPPINWPIYGPLAGMEGSQK